MGPLLGLGPQRSLALISLLVYLLILHARYIGWSGDFGTIVAAVAGTTAVLFTWYGVNFLLGSGMHSYGSGAAVGGRSAPPWRSSGCSLPLPASDIGWKRVERNDE